MNSNKLLISMTLIAFLSSGVVTASEHHSGHGGGPKSSGGSASTCGKPQLAKFSPAHLANVAPESIFSFYAYNIDKPEYVSATVKNIPVELSAEFKNYRLCPDCSRAAESLRLARFRRSGDWTALRQLPTHRLQTGVPTLQFP